MPSFSVTASKCVFSACNKIKPSTRHCGTTDKKQQVSKIGKPMPS